MEKLVIKSKKKRTCSGIIRIDGNLLDNINEISSKTNKSKMHVLNKCVEFALKYVEVKE